MGRSLPAASAVMILCTGCSSYKDMLATPKPARIPYIEEATPPPSYAEGSLWRDRAIYSDPKGRNLNDLITVKIAESTTATSKANANTSRDGSNSYDSGGLFGSVSDLGKASDVRATSTKAKYKGAGDTTRSTALSTRITARVVRVLGNGDLLFEGFRDIQLNNETQRLYIAGIVNPLQLDASNTVTSDQVAELRIGYGGKGVVDETLKPGYISRLLNLTWPF